MLAFIDLEERVPAAHPLRTIKRLADEALVELSPVLDRMYAEGGRPSIPPERLLKVSLLVDFQVTQATGTAGRDMVPMLLDQAKERCFHPKRREQEQELFKLTRFGAPIAFPVRSIGPLSAAPPLVVDPVRNPAL